jgi:hypothetical protein
VSLYLFEDYEGEDHYNESIRTAINTKQRNLWPNQAEFRFIAVVAKLQMGTESNEYELNVEPKVGKNWDGKLEYVARQLFVRVLNENQLNWTMEDHKEHTRTMVPLLNEDTRKDRLTVKDAWKVHKLRDYYVDEPMSWITPDDELLPLGMYMNNDVMRKKIMHFVFDRTTLHRGWANDHKEIVHKWFANGKSEAARNLGISYDYDWKQDEYYQPSIAVRRVLQQSSEKITATNTNSDDDMKIHAHSDDEEHSNMVKKLQTKQTQSKKHIQECHPVTPTKVQSKRRRRTTGSEKNPYIDDEAVEDDGVVSDGDEDAEESHE